MSSRHPKIKKSEKLKKFFEFVEQGYSIDLSRKLAGFGAPEFMRYRHKHKEIDEQIREKAKLRRKDLQHRQSFYNQLIPPKSVDTKEGR